MLVMMTNSYYGQQYYQYSQFAAGSKESLTSNESVVKRVKECGDDLSLSPPSHQTVILPPPAPHKYKLNTRQIHIEDTKKSADIDRNMAACSPPSIQDLSGHSVRWALLVFAQEIALIKIDQR